MPINPERRIIYHSCLRCPDGRQYDRLKKSSISRAATMSLQHHVEVVHPDHTGDWRELIGEKVTRKIGSIRAAKIEGAKNAKTDDTDSVEGARNGTEAHASEGSAQPSSTTTNEEIERSVTAVTAKKSKKTSNERSGHWDPYAYAWVWDE